MCTQNLDLEADFKKYHQIILQQIYQVDQKNILGCKHSCS